MGIFKSAGPSVLAVWSAWVWRGIVGAARAAKAQTNKMLEWASKALVAGAILFAAYWCLPWLGSFSPSMSPSKEMALAGPAPTASQWKRMQTLAARDLILYKEGSFDCAIEAAKRPGVGGAIFMSERCWAKAMNPVGQVYMFFHREQTRDPAAAFQAALKESARQASLGDRQGLAVGAKPVKEPAKDPDVEAVDALMDWFGSGRNLKIPLSTLRQAMRPQALWTKDWATTKEGSMAQSPDVVAEQRWEGLVFLCVALSGALALWGAGWVARGMVQSAARATQRRRLEALPAWEAKQMEKTAKAGKKMPTKSRL